MSALADKFYKNLRCVLYNLLQMTSDKISISNIVMDITGIGPYLLQLDWVNVFYSKQVYYTTLSLLSITQFTHIYNCHQ